MSSVSTESKLEWYLGGEYALRTIAAYLQLGFSLGMVQVRHACVPCNVVLHKAKCAWRRSITPAPEHEYIYRNEGRGTENKTPESLGHALKNAALSCTPANGASDPEPFLVELLTTLDSLAGITHSEAVDVRLLNRFMRQDIFVREQRNAQAAAGVAIPGSSTHASEENIAFRLAESDATYASVLAAGHPATITYRDFVVLTTLLSEAIAWDLFWIHEKWRRAHQQSKKNDAAAPTPLPSPHAIEVDCLALMLPNSVEYNAVWLAAARSGPLHTFLDLLYRSNSSSGSGGGGGPNTERGIYRPCRAALLNTNLASNAMLYHAIECAGSVMVVMDAMYSPLLFCNRSRDDAAGDQSGTQKLTLNVPPYVKRIYLWRHTDATGQPIQSTMTTEMKDLLRAFNEDAYGDAELPNAADASLGDDVSTPPPTPPLDLYDVVKPFVMRAQAIPAFTIGEMRHTYLISSSRARFLMHAMLSRPPLSWGSLLAHKNPSPHTKKNSAMSDVTAVGFTKRRQQLQQYRDKIASRLSRVLLRFHPTQPILLIYTSGTTGLPKAAQFSHLRFFATGFLSRVLYYRDKIAETVVQQINEVDYVATHPSAAAAAATAAAAALASEEQHHQCCLSLPSPTAPTPASGKQDMARINIDDARRTGVASTERRCPAVPHIFGIDSLGITRHKRNIVEATLSAIMNVCLWWLRFFARALGLEYFVVTAVEKRRYTPAQLAAIENERCLITVYDCLPMYHTVGSVFCLGHLLHALEEQQDAWATMRRCAPQHTRLAARVPTVRMILRSKFSASEFRNDLQRYHVTVVQYIGEVLRYAVLYQRNHLPVQATPCTADTKLSTMSVTTECDLLMAQNRTTWRVPYAFGNGLRQDIWSECMLRLNIAHPVEFYSSTEGNIFLLNLYGMPGIVGHIPRFPPPIEWLSMQYLPIFPFRVLRFEEESQQVYRDPKTGYCAHCAVGDVGEVVGEVIQGFDIFALRRFDGYHKSNRVAVGGGGASTVDSNGSTKKQSLVMANHEEDWQAREKKVISHVLWPYWNDCYFLSGDLIRMDHFGFCTFVDRVGDTFRWKGENVSTLEVSNALHSIHTTRVRVQEAVVYGVQLPGREGRAGMAMLTLQLRSPHSAPSLLGRHPLAEERRFLQDDLYGFLTNKVQHNSDGTTNRAVLPGYAIPLFLRMHDLVTDGHDNDDDCDKVLSHGAQPNDPLVSEDSTQTSTFKHKKGILARQGYEFDGSSTTCAEVPASAWGSGSNSTAREEATVTPYVRVYVLVSKQSLLKELRLPPEGGRGATSAAGYVPLTAANRAMFGVSMERCGW